MWSPLALGLVALGAAGAAAQTLRYSNLLGADQSDLQFVATAPNGDLIVAGQSPGFFLPGPEPARFAPGAVILESGDGGATFQPAAPLPFVPWAGLAFGDARTVVACSAEYGMARSPDLGRTWEPAVPANCRSVSAGPGVFYAVTGAGVFHSLDDGRTWRPLPGAGVGVHRVFPDLTHPGRALLWTATEGIVLLDTVTGQRRSVLESSPTDAHMSRSGDLYVLAGPVWRLRGDSEPQLVREARDLRGLALEPYTERLYGWTSDGRLFRAREGELGWDELPAAPWRLTAVPGLPDVLLAVSGSTNQLLRSTDAGRTFTRVMGGQPLLYPHPDLKGLVWAITPSVAAFVARLTPAGDQVKASALYGGSRGEVLTAMAVAPDGSVVIAGDTASTDLPLAGAFAASGTSFVARLSPGLDQLLHASYTPARRINVLAVAPDNTIWGAGGIQPQSTVDGYYFRLSPTGVLERSATLAGRGFDSIDGIKVAANGAVWLAATTDSTNLPVTANARQGSYQGGGRDAYLARVNPAGGFLYASYFGGAGDETVEALSLTRNGDLLLGLSTTSPGLPASAEAWLLAPANKRCFQFGLGLQRDGYIARLQAADAFPLLGTYLSLDCPQRLFAVAEDRLGRILAVIGTPVLPPVASRILWPEVPCSPAATGAVAEPRWASLLRLPPSFGAPDFATFLPNLISNRPATRPLTIDSFNHPVWFGTACAGAPVTADSLAAPGDGAALLVSVDIDTTPGPVPQLRHLDPIAAPGRLVTFDGRNLLRGPAFNLGLQTPLPRLLAETRVYLNGDPIPLVTADHDRITAVIPFATPPGRARLEFENGVYRSPPYAITIVEARPGFFPFVHNEDGTDNSEQNPAPPGSAVTVYLHGMGPVAVRDGDLAPSTPLAPTLSGFSFVLGGTPLTIEALQTVPGVLGAIVEARLRLPAPPIQDSVLRVQRGAQRFDTEVRIWLR
jgi:uncharacterized protein (TIGR03437 family)